MTQAARTSDSTTPGQKTPARPHTAGGGAGRRRRRRPRRIQGRASGPSRGVCNRAWAGCPGRVAAFLGGIRHVCVCPRRGNATRRPPPRRGHSKAFRDASQRGRRREKNRVPGGECRGCRRLRRIPRWVGPGRDFRSRPGRIRPKVALTMEKSSARTSRPPHAGARGQEGPRSRPGRQGGHVLPELGILPVFPAGHGHLDRPRRKKETAVIPARRSGNRL